MDTTNLAAERQLILDSGLFNPEWYLATYPDVAMAGMDPAEHFLKYGALLLRDPSPNFSTGFFIDTRPGVQKENLNPLVYRARYPKKSMTEKNVLFAAANLVARGYHEKAIALAEKHLPPHWLYTIHVLRANAALDEGDESGWLGHLNAYLTHLGLEPVRLRPSGSILERLSTRPLEAVEGGSLVSVIMPAWNAEKTVKAAAQSVLDQTWRNLELLIVDDASEDGTWTVLQELAKNDPRVRIQRNRVNVGPYVSKNLALNNAHGDYVTGHDADDWAHPQRLANQLEVVLRSQGSIKACLAYMIRINPEGRFSSISKVGKFTFDGVTRKASISCLFERRVLQEQLGYWDSVRFAADSEMIERTTRVLGEGFQVVQQISMICLDLENSLTNHPEHGVNKITGISPSRAAYRQSWLDWLNARAEGQSAYLAFLQPERRYDADLAMIVPMHNIEANLNGTIP